MSVVVSILFSATSLIAQQSASASVGASRPTAVDAAVDTVGETTVDSTVDSTVDRTVADGDSSARGGSTANSSVNPTTRSAPTQQDAPLLRPAVRATNVVRPVQGTAAAGVLHPPLEIVDAGREDIGPLATSLRSDPVDARLPTGFHRVYRVPGSDSQLMRGNGALFAVFPESIYQDGRALLPPGTVYHIGMPDLTPAPIHPDALSPHAHATKPGAIGVRIGTTVDARLDFRIRPTRPAPIGHTERYSTAQSGDRSRVDDAFTLEEYLGVAARNTPVDAERAQDAAAVIEQSNPAMLPKTAPVPSALDTGTGSKHADAQDPYAYLKLGPARIARD